ncbi:unnamed protein product [Boreogadus saida]
MAALKLSGRYAAGLPHASRALLVGRGTSGLQIHRCNLVKGKPGQASTSTGTVALALALAGPLPSFRANPAPIWRMSFIAAQLRPPSNSNSVCFFTASALALRYLTMLLHQLFPQMPPSTELIATLKNSQLLLRPCYIH